MIEELPDEPEDTESTAVQQSEISAPEKQTGTNSILLKDDETPPKKNVTFDIEKTTVKEFYKNEKIEKLVGTQKRKGGKGKNRQQ